MVKFPSSYRDPSSSVFYDNNGRIFRQLTFGKDLYNSFKFFPQVLSRDQDGLCEVTRIPFVTYFYEWNFEQCRDAALFYLELLNKTLKSELTLSDGTPLNISYLGNGNFSFFDHGSLIKRDDNFWPSYFQFLREFVYPVIFSAYAEIEYPNQLLPLLNNNSWQHHFLPRGLSRFGIGFMAVRSNLKIMSRPSINAKESSLNSASQKKILKHTIPFYQNYLSSLKRKRESSKWSDYYEGTVIKDGYVDNKLTIVKSLIKQVEDQVSCCIDLGASSGLFPVEITKAFNHFQYIAIESDPNAYSRLYEASKKNNYISIFSNLLQLTPAAGLGAGYSSLSDRLEKVGDLVLALGIVHHMIHEGGLSYEDLFKYFSSISKPNSFIIVEYISPEDEKYKLIRNSSYAYLEDMHYFESSMNNRFNIISKIQLYETRWVYLAEKK
jgi:precorrin-6B methylase 2